MNKREAFDKVWSLLSDGEKRHFYIVLAVIVFSSLSSAVMVGSVLPFLTVLADPGQIQNIAALRIPYETLGFQSDFNYLVFVGIVSLGVILLVNLIQIAKVYVTSHFVHMRQHSLSERILAMYLGQDFEFFLTANSGKLTQTILAETGQVVTGFIKPTIDLIASALTIASIVILLMWVDYRVSIGSFGCFALLFLLIFGFTRPRLGALGRKRAQHNEMRFRIANEAFGGIKDLKVLGREANYINSYRSPSLRMARTSVGQSLLSNIPPFIVLPLAYGGIILVCLLLMDRSSYDGGESNLSDILPVLGVFAFAGQRLLPELTRIYQHQSLMQSSLGAVEHVIKDFRDLKAKIELPEAPPAPLGLRKSLCMDDVSYQYPSSDKGGLRRLSLTIDAGEKIGVVGPTGAGKTTFADIVLGLLPLTKGAFIVDGSEIKPENLRAWQQSVGYVPQNIFLSDASIARNIAFGVAEDEIDQERVRTCARMAQLDRFIETQLEAGFETIVGERGVRLSGGQRQRIGIARALYHDADLILFDEATSALDSATENDVIKAVQALPGDKTIIMIAHRLSTLRICDRILVLEEGELVGFGSWGELMKSSGTFRTLVAGSKDTAQWD